MAKRRKYHLNIKIDRLTNSIVNAITGDSFETDMHPVVKEDLKGVSKKNGWKFAWKSELKYADRQVYKLTIRSNPDNVQGLLCMGEEEGYYYIYLVESAPFNRSKKKVYEGVAGNLFAFACKTSWDKGYQGFVSFNAKTKLVDHYETTLGAVHIGDDKMIIFPHEALALIKQYYPS